MFSLTAAGVAERLAWVAGGEDVGVDARPVDGAQVPKVGGVGEPAGEDGAGVAVDVGDVSGAGVEHGFDSEIEAAIPGAQADNRGGGRCHVDMMPCRLGHCYLHGGELIRGRGDALRGSVWVPSCDVCLTSGRNYVR